MNIRKLYPLLAALLFLTAASLQADVKLPAIFGDHMVLQEGAKLPVWGTADPGEQVTVSAENKTAKGTADAQGKWRVELAALDTKAMPITVTVKGKNRITLSDVLVGEVWLCSGQSNMEFDLGGKGTFGGAHNAATIVPQANDPELRFFLVKKQSTLDPAADVDAKWEVCTPQTAALFSAVGYFFGNDLRHALNKPVGLIGSYWGGTRAQSWMSESGLLKDPKLASYAEVHDKTRAAFSQATAAYPAEIADYPAKLAEWKQNIFPAYQLALNDWNTAARAAIVAGQTPAPKPLPSTPLPRKPALPVGPPSNLFNGMIAPLIPFAIKGVIWYQGEANSGRAAEYRTLFPEMISDWREKWGEGDFPFLFVQLAAYNVPTVQNWPFLREAQALTLALPKTGMATAIDIGLPTNIHPLDKQDVGNRLALVAEHVAYGGKAVYSGPVYEAMKANGPAISLSFTHEGGGLIIGSAPWVGDGLKHLPTDQLIGFTIAGDDKNWIPADAKIVGNTVEVSSAQVAKPVAVRYDWANFPEGNLYNKEMLPALPFRTDDWTDPVAEGLAPPPPRAK